MDEIAAGYLLLFTVNHKNIRKFRTYVLYRLLRRQFPHDFLVPVSQADGLYVICPLHAHNAVAYVCMTCQKPYSPSAVNSNKKY